MVMLSSPPTRNRPQVSRDTAIMRRSRATASRVTVSRDTATRTRSLGAIIGQLLGNRYNVTGRTAVQQCASAAMAQANAQYRPRNGYGQPYGNAYGYNNQGYNPAMNMRVTAITNVQRQRNGLRVSGLMDSRSGYEPYGQAYGYRNQRTGDLSFRCNVDYRGVVTNVRVRGNATSYRG